MTIEPPQPPTAPAPAVRPTPPTPPRIDKTPFAKPDEKISVDKPAEKIVDKPAEKSADKPVDTPVEKPAPAEQKVIVIPPDAPIVSDGQSDYDRGQDVLRQFRELDAKDKPQTSTEPPVAVPKVAQSDGHGTVYWLLTIIFVGVAAFVIVKKFLIPDKPALTKSELFADSSAKLKAASEKVKPSPKPPPKSDDKGKHFEVRV